MDPRNLVRQSGKVANERGRGNEKRLLDACALPSRPAWMQSVRKATRGEDHDGIDVVIESDVGKLYVQVKSSRAGKAHFGSETAGHVSQSSSFMAAIRRRRSCSASSAKSRS